jgi:hypothetical protein
MALSCTTCCCCSDASPCKQSHMRTIHKSTQKSQTL